ncbi:MAG: DNA polymerase III subunit gamma/tau [SAR324 cluster bacterium]|nr:DNA polymerase III subunit gamma/tau [SAR324 cluster bacterium]
MPYVVLARKLRPTRFDDLVGQETSAQVLKNAIMANRVSHAFLFTGSRGVGKTSAARILTKAINCLNPQDANPCNDCPTCREITDNASPDVFEIDAASNRGIDNIRELRENIKYAPANCRYKVYIIDEAHMLTLESFNALLKTLEEPPPHVKFILATTDPHKIPQTIISRCQRYDFVRIPLGKIVDYLEQVVRDEKIELSRTALEMIARHAVGGMRDSLTAIDQVISYAGISATDEEVAKILGMIDTQVRSRLLNALLQKNSADAMEAFYAMQQHGHDYQDILSEIMQSVKNISLVRTLMDSSGKVSPTLFLDISKDELAQYQELSTVVTVDELQQVFHILLELEERIKRSTHAQICFEMALMQMTAVQPLVGIPELLSQVKNLRGNEGEQGGQPPAAKSSTPVYQQHSTPPSVVSESAPVLKKAKQQVVREPEQKAAKDPLLVEEQNTESSVTEQKDPLLVEEQNTESSVTEQKVNSIERLSPPKEWENFVAHVQQSSPRIGGVLKHAVVLELNDQKIQIGFREVQFAKMLAGEQQKSLHGLASAFFKSSIEVVLIQESPLSSMSLTLAEKRQQLLDAERERKRNLAKENGTTQMILKTFPGSKITDIQIQEPEL